MRREGPRTCEIGDEVLHFTGDALAAAHELLDDAAHAYHLLARRDQTEAQVLRVLDLRHLYTNTISIGYQLKSNRYAFINVTLYKLKRA